MRESEPLGYKKEIALVVAGFSLTWFVAFTVAYSFVFLSPEHFTYVQTNLARVLYIAGIALMQALLYLFAPSLIGKQFRLPLAAIAFVLVLGAPGSLLSPLALSGVGAYATIAAMLLAGMWQGAMHLLWTEYVAVMDHRYRYRVFHLSTLIGAVLFMLVTFFARALAGFFVAGAAVLVFIAYIAASRFIPLKDANRRTISRKLSKGMRKSTIILFVYGAVFGVGIYSCMSTDAVGVFTSYASIGLALAVGALFLLFFDAVLNKRYRIEEITLVLSPVLAVLLILLSLSSGLMTWVAFLLIIAVLTVFDNSAFCFALNAIEELDVNPFVGISRARMSVQSGMFLAALANFLFVLSGAQPTGKPLIVPLVLVAFLFIMMATVSRIDFIPKQFMDLPPKPAVEGSGEDEQAAAAREPVDIVNKIAEDYDLSDRECEVLELIIAGNSTPAIAEKLFISQNTVKSHRYHIFRKMTVESKQEIINIRDQYIERYKNL